MIPYEGGKSKPPYVYPYCPAINIACRLDVKFKVNLFHFQLNVLGAIDTANTLFCQA